MTHARTRLKTYTAYSISCAAVWAVILAVAQRRVDPEMRTKLRLGCIAWWSGWTSATIARVSYPPPKQLKPASQKRLGIASIGLIALGLLNVIRALAAGRRPGASDR